MTTTVTATFAPKKGNPVNGMFWNHVPDFKDVYSTGTPDDRRFTSTGVMVTWKFETLEKVELRVKQVTDFAHALGYEKV